MSLLLHHFSLSPPTSRSPRSHFEHFHRMPNSSHPPTDRNRRITSSDWDPGGWRTTTQLQRRSSSANLFNTQLWSRSFDESSMSVQEPSSYRKPIQQSRNSMACTRQAKCIIFPKDAQKGRPARPQRVKTGSVPSGAHGATNKEHRFCARRRVVRRPGPR